MAAIASSLFYVPLVGHILRWLGCIEATHANIEHAINVKGQDCFLMADGIAGAFHSNTKREVACIASRKGYFRYRYIVPVYFFGHTQLFDYVFPHHQSWLAYQSRRLRYAFIGFWPPLPPREHIAVAYGHRVKGDEFDASKAFTALFNHYKCLVFGYKDKELVIV